MPGKWHLHCFSECIRFRSLTFPYWSCVHASWQWSPSQMPVKPWCFHYLCISSYLSSISTGSLWKWGQWKESVPPNSYNEFGSLEKLNSFWAFHVGMFNQYVLDQARKWLVDASSLFFVIPSSPFFLADLNLKTCGQRNQRWCCWDLYKPMQWFVRKLG